MGQPVLTLTRIAKSFGGTRALVDANLHLHAGEVTALIGENGAGKSTLVKIIAGLHAADTGELHIDGQPVRINSAAGARAAGISIVHQESLLFDNLTVAENILINARPMRYGCIDWPELRRRATAILRQLDAPFDADQKVGDLSVARKHLVQIARGLSSDARILILDEPTAALSHREVQDLQRTILRLKTAGCAILFISHRFEEVFAMADRYVVFRDGRSVGDGQLADVTRDQLIHLMVGRPLEQILPAKPSGPGRAGSELLRVEHLSRGREFRDVSFQLQRGEILGVYGLVGAGRSEVMQCVFGLTQPDAGRIVVNGVTARIAGPGHAIALGLAYLPEDRQHQGALLPLSIAANIALPNLQRLSRVGLRQPYAIAALARDWITKLQIKAIDTDQRVEELSGGNQQKVVLAKWLATGPLVLIVDEPTKGIDVGAKAAVHAVLRELAVNGLGIIMVSSDLPEVLGMADRVLVMRRGCVRAELTGADASPANLAQAATAA